MNANSEILLTPLQRAQKKYYEKRKSTQKYKDQIKLSNKKYYEKIKDDPEFKEKVSKQKKEYYYNNKCNIVEEILL